MSGTPRREFGREWWDSPEGIRSTWITVNYQRSGSPWGSEGSDLALHATGPTLIEGLAPPHGQQREAELVPHLPRSWCHPFRGARPHPYKGGAVHLDKGGTSSSVSVAPTQLLVHDPSGQWWHPPEGIRSTCDRCPALFPGQPIGNGLPCDERRAPFTGRPNSLRGCERCKP